MLIQIPQVLDAAQLAQVQRLIGAVDWIDGNATSGAQAALAKHNRQLPEDSPAARKAGVDNALRIKRGVVALTGTYHNLLRMWAEV